ncbi:MAG: ABC transporter permease [Vicinamibacteria bacterium]
MKDTLYLAWRYVAYHRVKAAILIASISLIIFLPIGLNVLVGQSADELTARAEATPLLVGAKGSPLELALNSLYFDTELPARTTYAQVSRIDDSGLARAIPLYVRFRARDHPIVGTTLEYFDFRGLRVAKGRQMAVLGECVLGAQAARSLGVGPGGSVVSSPESVFDIAGVYPLKMQVVGVLEHAFSPDDRAVFVDLKTAWVIEGLGHGHQDLTQPQAAGAILEREGNTIRANASLVQYNEITPENRDSFHFHGGMEGFPITALVAVPNDRKSGVILLGRFQADEERAQIVRPAVVIRELLETVFTVRSFVVAGILLVSMATLAMAVLVLMLSLRLRRREIETLVKIGGSRGRVAFLIVSEAVIVVLVGAVLAGGLTALTHRFGSTVIQTFLLS